MFSALIVQVRGFVFLMEQWNWGKMKNDVERKSVNFFFNLFLQGKGF